MKRIAIAILFGCGPVVVPSDGETTGAAHASTSSESTSSETTSTADSAASDTSTTTTTTSSGAADVTSSNFIDEPDGGSAQWECDPWAQDCPVGEKCVAWANDGGGAWNALRCSPVAEDPRQRGESCTVVDSGVSGIDDCAVGTMCWNVDPDTLIGVCVEMCGGSETNPVCSDPCEQCSINNDGVLPLCLLPCDPVVQDCIWAQKCAEHSGSFWCTPDVQNGGVFGEPCTQGWDCAAGFHCVDAERLPACNDERCCTSLCDVDAADACGSDSGTVCIPWSEHMDQVDACVSTTHVGSCEVSR